LFYTSFLVSHAQSVVFLFDQQFVDSQIVSGIRSFESWWRIAGFDDFWREHVTRGHHATHIQFLKLKKSKNLFKKLTRLLQ